MSAIRGIHQLKIKYQPTFAFAKNYRFRYKFTPPCFMLAKCFVLWKEENFGCCFSAVPESEQIATELGLMYLGLGDTKRAFQQFGTALAQSANYAKATLPMAYVMQVKYILTDKKTIGVCGKYVYPYIYYIMLYSPRQVN